jgi:phosphate transport system substrate-binding protein
MSVHDAVDAHPRKMALARTHVEGRRRMHLRFAIAPLALALLGLAAGCSKVDADDRSSTEIEIDGSSTVKQLTEAIATDFIAAHPDISPSTAVSGTGGGFKRFVRGETDISNASRPIKQSELESAQSNGVEFIELPVALDGITFAVHPDNDWVESLTVDELRTIFSRDGGVETWADIRDGWPDDEIVLWSPGYDSGTYDFFREVVFPDDTPARNDLNLSENDHTLVRGIKDDVNALGFFGFAYYSQNQGELTSIAIVNPKGEAVRPNLETIASGSYAPFSRPLYIYINAESAEREAVQTFVEYYLDQAGRLAPEVGYAPLTDEQYEMVEGLFADRVTGTVWLEADGGHIHAPIDEVYDR